MQKLLRLLDGAQVSADGHLLQRGEAQHLHGFLDLARRHLVAELTPEGRRDDGHHLLTLVDGVDQLEQLALVHNGAEGAVHQTHAAGHALVLIDDSPAPLVAGNGVHAAGLGAGPLELDNGLIGAALLAPAALDALVLVDDGLALVERDGILGAGVVAVVGQTALTQVRHLIVGGRAGVAGVFDNVDQRRIIVLLGHSTLLHAVTEQAVLRHGAQRQAHGKADAFAHNGPLQEDRLPLRGLFAGQYLIWQLFHPGIILVIRHPRHLGKHALTGIGNAACNVSHGAPFLCGV